MISTKLTGNIRYRNGKEGRLFGEDILILQVEVHHIRQGESFVDPCPDGSWDVALPDINRLEWRDAKTEDLLSLSELHRGSLTGDN